MLRRFGLVGVLTLATSLLVPALFAVVSAVAFSDPAAANGLFETLPPGSDLPSDQECADQVLGTSRVERRPANADANQTTGGPSVNIDGADPVWNAAFRPRISGEFAGTTEQILRWGACKWGFNEGSVRARAWVESSWLMSTEGDVTDDPTACLIIGRVAPCPQSFGLLQVKSAVHIGTYPRSTESTAFGIDYALAWTRACFEGSFVWLGPDYAPGNERGCIGAWFSGEWFNEGALNYLEDYDARLAERPWYDSDFGDVNCDNEVNIIDALFIVQFEVLVRDGVTGCPLDSPTSELNQLVGDVNNDLRVNVIDALLIAQCDAALANIFCPL